MVITKMFCDFCKKETPNIPYTIDVKRVYDDPDINLVYGDLDVLQTFDCCKSCMEKMFLNYKKGGVPYDTETY